MNEKAIEDDGSLAFLNIPRNANSRSFNCAELKVITKYSLLLIIDMIDTAEHWIM